MPPYSWLRGCPGGEEEDERRAEISKIATPEGVPVHLREARGAHLVEQLPTEMVEGQTAFGGEGIAMVFRFHQVTDSPLLVDDRSHQVLRVLRPERHGEQQAATRPQDAVAFRERPAEVGDVLEDLERNDEVEAGARESEPGHALVANSAGRRLAKPDLPTQVLAADDVRMPLPETAEERSRLLHEVDG